MFAFLLACTPAPEPAAPDPAASALQAAPAPLQPLVADAPVGPRETPPRIASLALEPKNPTITDAVRARVDAMHPTGAAIDLDYAWTINDEEVPGAISDTLAAGKYRKGDRVAVMVTARVGTKDVSRTSEPVVVANTLPTLRTGPRDLRELDGFRFRADDLDGDALTWSLEGAPDGMRISEQGVMSYAGSKSAQAGNYRVAVIASDGDGFGRLEFDVRVTAGSDAAKAPPAPE